MSARRSLARVLVYGLLLLLCAGGERKAWAQYPEDPVALGWSPGWFNPSAPAPTLPPLGRDKIVWQGDQDGPNPVPQFYFDGAFDSYLVTNRRTVYVSFFPYYDDRDPSHKFTSYPLTTGYTILLPYSDPAFDNFAIGMIPNPTGWPDGVTAVPDNDAAHPRFVAGYDRKYNGKYWLDVYFSDATGLHFNGRSIVWLVDGKWFLKPPGPHGGSPNQPPPGVASNPPNWDLEVTVLQGGRAANSRSVTLNGIAIPTGQTATKTTNSSGVVTWTNLPVAHGSVSVATASGAPASVRSVMGISGQLLRMRVDFDDAGNGSWVGGEDTSQQGGGGFWADLMNSLFVPKQSTVDHLKRDLSSFWNWGPFALISELAGLSGTAAGDPIPLNIPVPAWHFDMAGHPSWAPSGYTAEIHDPGITSTPIWSWVRGAMGICTWLTFAIGVAHYLKPRFVT